MNEYNQHGRTTRSIIASYLQHCRLNRWEFSGICSWFNSVAIRERSDIWSARDSLHIQVKETKKRYTITNSRWMIRRRHICWFTGTNFNHLLRFTPSHRMRTLNICTWTLLLHVPLYNARPGISLLPCCPCIVTRP